MRTIFLKVSQHLPLSETIPPLRIINRYGQLLIYLAVLGLIAYGYIFAHGMLMHYLADLSPGAVPGPASY